MPLSSVVEYLNERLHQLHPTARLSQQAGFRYHNRVLTAGIAGFRLFPHQVPVVRPADGALVAYRAQLRVETSRGHPMRPESLYVHAWDAEDVLFLDRFLRTFHALHHLSEGHDADAWLAVDVHLRHVSAIPEQHGQVFQELLHRLGLAPAQVVLRLNGRALQQDPHVQAAARSFIGHGYRLLATRPDVEDTDWTLLRELGVGWVGIPVPTLASRHGQETLSAWGRQAQSHGIGLWIERIASAEALERAQALGAELVEGELFQAVAHLPIREAAR
ncbi:EAL domain-containing protein [Thiobaca trueperi]|uniref:EAL domain-containing protein (Putative c-di-GMP-specific phosphodiesterase class I) n=1 Tax=Thiobaca trueperi TaxID=127458 RepID=A0A4V2V116_9GAMM|nr:EAL domain-containing protein [Thiobaca trueperi]TCT19432.1 EAL domain-containing protein (putative c-di-GMP-specific phosphodiesterase class I) [Thiobaca trueperi]